MTPSARLKGAFTALTTAFSIFALALLSGHAALTAYGDWTPSPGPTVSSPAAVQAAAEISYPATVDTVSALISQPAGAQTAALLPERVSWSGGDTVVVNRGPDPNADCTAGTTSIASLDLPRSIQKDAQAEVRYVHCSGVGVYRIDRGWGTEPVLPAHIFLVVLIDPNGTPDPASVARATTFLSTTPSDITLPVGAYAVDPAVGQVRPDEVSVNGYTEQAIDISNLQVAFEGIEASGSMAVPFTGSPEPIWVVTQRPLPQGGEAAAR